MRGGWGEESLALSFVLAIIIEGSAAMNKH